MSSANHRLNYIDQLKGMAIIGVVWFHTNSPTIINFPFRIGLFFFLSGIFFRPYPLKEFCLKKLNRLVIPFIFFYVLNYLFRIIFFYIEKKTLSGFDFSSIFNIFGMYCETESFEVNRPLWFILALLQMQFILYFLIKTVKNKWIILAIGFIITIVGLLGFYSVKTPLMISRSSIYYIYFFAGYALGKDIIKILERKKRQFWTLFGVSFIIFAITIILFYCASYNNHYLQYTRVFSLIILLMCSAKLVGEFKIMKLFEFWGSNSYTLLGLHETCLFPFIYFFSARHGHVGTIDGIICLVVTLSIIYPITLLLNKYCPMLTGKSTNWNNYN